MSTISHTRRSERPSGPGPQPLWCQGCGTDYYLTVESVHLLDPARADMVNVSFTCGGCGSVYIRPATLPDLASILNRPGPVPVLGVLQFDGSYIHCGSPMHTSDSKDRSILTSASTDQPGEPILEVYLRTRVLHCGCGFQMEIPR